MIFAVFDPRGEIGYRVERALHGLRSHAERIVVVVNGSLGAEGRQTLEQLADDIVVRDNTGYDVWAFKAGLERAADGLAGFDEVLLANDSWYGPMDTFDEVFERMSSRAVHFWGMTDHAADVDGAFAGSEGIPHHLQTYWIAIRRGVFLSEQWQRYWSELPQICSHDDAVKLHELVFTQVFASEGFRWEAAFPAERYPSSNPSVLNADLLLEQGCPVLKRRPLFHWPPFLERNGVISSWVLDVAVESGYPRDEILVDLVRTTKPKDLNVNLALHDTLSNIPTQYDPEHPLRVLVIAHIFYEEMTSEILDFADNLPGTYDLVVTTPFAERAGFIEECIRDRNSQSIRSSEVRVLTSNNGRDQGAFLVGCRDLLRVSEHDLVVKLHSKKTPQDGFNVGRHFKQQQFTNLLNDPGYAANIVGLFQREPRLGLVYPPTIHIGYPTMGRGWWSNRPAFEALCREVGIQVPLDDITPLAPYGSMYIARPEALRLLVDKDWSYDDFGGAEAYQDGGLAHVLERMPSYVAAEVGYYTRTVTTAEYMAISHTSFEFNLDRLSATIPGTTDEQILFLRRAGYVGDGRFADFVRIYLRLNHPGLGAKLRSARDRARRAPDRALKALRRRLGSLRRPNV